MSTELKVDEGQLELAKAFFSAAWREIKYAWERLRVWRSRRQKPPFEEAEAAKIIYPLLAGHIVRAISYRNVGSKNVFIAAMRRSSERDHDASVHVLEQTGGTFRELWKSESMLFLDGKNLEVKDVDRDGHREIILEYKSRGTGAGTRVLMVYSTRSRQLLRLSEYRSWQNLAGPTAAEVSIEPEDDPEAVAILETEAKRRGLLQAAAPIDLNNLEFSIQRWHKENGAHPIGEIRIHLYPGWPPYGSTVVDECDTGDIVWIAQFKGPLFGYVKSKNQHFIAYSPAWFYNWPKCLAYDGDRLWFGIHCKKGLMYFHPENRHLALIETLREEPLPEVNELRIEDGNLVLNETQRVPIADLELRG